MVGRGFTGYERELRNLLEGDPPSVRAYSRSLPPAERSEFERLIDGPFLVIRGAGSLGLDLVAMRWGLSFPIEVKASSEPVIRFTAASGRANAQLASHRKAISQAGLAVLYAYRRLGLRSEESWRIFLGSDPPAKGALKWLCRRLPPIGETREGNGILRWEEGQRLSEFLTVSRTLFESDGGGTP